LTAALIFLAAAALIAVGYLWRDGRHSEALAANQRAVAAVADTLAEIRQDRAAWVKTADSLASLAKRQTVEAERMETEAWRQQARATAYRDSLRIVGATTVPIAEYDTVLALAEYRGEQLRVERDIRVTMQDQIKAAASLRVTDSTEIAVWRSRAERAERLLASVRPPGASKNGGWGMGPTVAIGAVTVAACAERVLSAGCVAGVAVMASRL
jgi:hypothetical protein